MNHPTLSRSRSKLNRRFASLLKKLVLHFLNVLCEIFQRTRSQTTLFLVCGCKGRHFPQYDKTSRQLFLMKNGKNLNTHYIIYIQGRKKKAEKHCQGKYGVFSRPSKTGECFVPNHRTIFLSLTKNFFCQLKKQLFLYEKEMLLIAHFV